MCKVPGYSGARPGETWVQSKGLQGLLLVSWGDGEDQAIRQQDWGNQRPSPSAKSGLCSSVASVHMWTAGAQELRVTPLMTELTFKCPLLRPR